LLWAKLFREFEHTLGIPADAALPYLDAMARTIGLHKGAALTGPLARGDTATMEANLTALGDDPFAAVYRALVDCYRHAPPLPEVS